MRAANPRRAREHQETGEHRRDRRRTARATRQVDRIEQFDTAFIRGVTCGVVAAVALMVVLALT